MTDTPKTSSFRKRMVYVLLIAVLALLATVAAQIDDWSRDLTTNYAQTSNEQEDPLLRTTVISASPDDVESALQSFVNTHSNWEWVDSDASPPGQHTFHLTRTTRLFRFVDDVLVFLEQSSEGVALEVSSKSRVGKGDLGQNPRNIRELNRALREQLDVAE